MERNREEQFNDSKKSKIRANLFDLKSNIRPNLFDLELFFNAHAPK